MSPEEKATAGLMSIIGVISISASLGYIYRPAIGWLVFGALVLAMLIPDYIQEWRKP